ncbi:hypothetical protein ULG90_23785 [Halopseudomonas pachastrellae]|nr:hypothetical protein ULG90_23785 [Halopseudomonas pachastrellae]
MSQAQEINKLPLILTAIVTVVLTVAVLHCMAISISLIREGPRAG